MELPARSAEENRFQNSVMGVRRNVHFEFADQKYRFQFEQHAARSAAAISISVVSAESGELWITLADTSHLTGLDEILGEALLEDLPASVAAIVLESTLAALIDDVGAQVGESFSIHEVIAGPPSDRYRNVLHFRLADDEGAETLGRIDFEDNWMATLESLLSCAAPSPCSDFDAVRVPAAIEIGQATLTLSELQEVELGDVIMIARTSLIDKNQVQLLLPGDVTVPCQVEGDRLLVLDDAGSSSRVAQPLHADPSNVAELCLPVSIRCGRVVMPIHQLLELAAGEALAAEEAAGPSVDILVGENLFGNGELVQGTGGLGVRLLSLQAGPWAQVRHMATAAAAAECVEG